MKIKHNIDLQEQDIEKRAILYNQIYKENQICLLKHLEVNCKQHKHTEIETISQTNQS